MALLLGGLGLLLSLWAGSQRASLGLALFLLLALHAPAMMPAASLRGWVGDAVKRLDPFSQGFPYLEQMVLQGYPIGQELRSLTGLVVAAVALPALAVLAAGRLTLLPRRRS
jgi:ABC-2 type transport system permease protein